MDRSTRLKVSVGYMLAASKPLARRGWGHCSGRRGRGSSFLLRISNAIRRLVISNAIGRWTYFHVERYDRMGDDRRLVAKVNPKKLP